jgi:hypothetical protein
MTLRALPDQVERSTKSHERRDPLSDRVFSGIVYLENGHLQNRTYRRRTKINFTSYRVAGVIQRCAIRFWQVFSVY